jgi:hypothetical protein
MDETQIICCGELVDAYGRRMMVLDFAPEDSTASKKQKKT